MSKTLQLTIAANQITLSDFDLMLIFQAASMTPIKTTKDDAERALVQEILNAVEGWAEEAAPRVLAFEQIPVMDVSRRNAALGKVGKQWAEVILSRPSFIFLTTGLLKDVKTQGANHRLVELLHTHLGMATALDPVKE